MGQRGAGWNTQTASAIQPAYRVRSGRPGYTRPAMNSGSRRWIRRSLDLREGEGGQVALVGGLLFTIIAGHIMLETARDALFLSSIPARYLTFVYAGLAGLVLVVLSLNSRLVRRFGRRSALIGTLMMASYGTVLLYLLPRSTIAVFALYLWSGLLGTVLIVQFWMLAGQLFTVAQGKRVFGPVAAGGALGAFAGAASAAVMVELMPVAALLPVVSGLYLAAAFVLTGASREDIVLPPPPVEKNREKARNIVTVLRDSSYLRRMVLLVVLATAAALTTDYLFKAVAARSIAADDLGAFFARFYAVLNAIALVVQLVGSGKVVRRLGVVAAATVLPLLIAAGGIATLVLGGLFLFVLLTKGTDGVLRHSLHRVATELLWMPLSSEQRDQAKGAIDGVLTRVVQGLVAGLLFVLATFGADTTVVLAGLVAVFAAVWLVVAASMRGPYLSLFRAALARGTFDPGEELDLRSVELVVEALASTDEERVIAALELLDAKGRSRLIPALILYHESSEILSRSLRIIATPERRDWVALTERLLTHTSGRVRIEALRVMAKNHLLSGLESRLLDIDPAVRAHAAFWLVQEHQRDDEDRSVDPRVRGVLDMPPPRGTKARIALLDAIADDGDRSWVPVIEELGRCDEPEVAEAASLAMQKVPDRRFLPTLIDQLGVRRGRGAARAAIVAVGEPALDALSAAFDADSTSPRVRIHLPRTVALFGSQRAADFLFERLATESRGMVRLKIVRGLVRLVKEHHIQADYAAIFGELQRNLREYFRLLSLCSPLEPGGRRQTGDGSAAAESRELLVGLIRDKARQSLERVFMVLEMAHPNEDLKSAYVALRSGDRTLRANANEFIDALTRNPLYGRGDAYQTAEWLRIVVDDLAPGEKVARAAAAVAEIPATYRRALSLLLRDDDDMVSSIAAFHALDLSAASAEASALAPASDVVVDSAGQDRGADPVMDLRDEVFTVARERPILEAVGEEAEEQFEAWEAASRVA